MPAIDQVDIAGQQGAVDAALPFSQKLEQLLGLLASQGVQANATNVNSALENGFTGAVGGGGQNAGIPVPQDPLNLTGETPLQVDAQGGLDNQISPPGQVDQINAPVAPQAQTLNTEGRLDVTPDPNVGNVASLVSGADINSAGPGPLPFIGEGPGGLSALIPEILAALGISVGAGALSADVVRGDEDARQSKKLNQAKKGEPKGAALEKAVASKKKNKTEKAPDRDAARKTAFRRSVSAAF